MVVRWQVTGYDFCRREPARRSWWGYRKMLFFTPTIIFGGLPYAVKNTDIFDNFSGPLKI
jgi:hypothetical protein